MQYTVRITLCCLLLLAGSCDNYLDVAPQGQIDEEAIRQDPSVAQDLVTGVYNIMFEGNVHGFPYVSLTNVASDDADKGSHPADGATIHGRMDELTMDGTVTLLNDIWSGYYRGIARANQALEMLPESPLGEEDKNRLLGETRFLRAYFYFKLVRFFGGVPKIDRVPGAGEANDEEFQTRAGEEEIYQLIIEDLEFGVENLPVKEAAEVGRVTQAAAMGMLAKVHLYRQNYQEAYELTDAIINGEAGSYELAQNYEMIWREVGENNEESVFEVQAGVNNACDAGIQLYTVCQGPRAGGQRGWQDLGFGFGTPSETLLEEYEEGDPRREATVIFINPSPQGTVLWDGFRVPSRDSVENDRYNYKAYHSRTAESNCGVMDRLPKNLRILRFAEILLIHAEAGFELGSTSAALNDINRIRERADLDPLSSLTREDIWHERRIELAMEHDRYFDLVRQEAVEPGRAVEAFAAHGKEWVKGKHEVFPIPQPQIDLSGGLLEQNPNY